MEETEIKMLRFSLGVTRMDRIRDENITDVRCSGEKVREAKMRWFGHVQRRDGEYIRRGMLKVGTAGQET